MLEHDIEIFATLAGEISALIDTENHYLKEHRIQEAVRLLPEKNKLHRDYEKVCKSLSENLHFSALREEKRTQIKDLARNLHKKMQENKTVLEMAMEHTDNIVQIYVDAHRNSAPKNVYDRTGKNVRHGILGAGQSA